MGSNMPTLLRLVDLCVNYGSHLALHNISAEIAEGDYVCVIGKNGSGKSTLLKAILGLLPKKSGDIIINGGLLKNDMGIGYLSQQMSVKSDFPASVNEVVLSGCAKERSYFPFFSAKEKKLADKNMEYLNIIDLKKKSFGELSGGQQQRVLLARALCQAEKLLILDEPVTGLDPTVTVDFYRFMKKLNEEKNMTVIMTSHDIDKAVKYATKILHLETDMVFFGNTADYLLSNAGKKFLGGGHHECF